MKSNLFYILKKELREVFRDKKSLAMMLIIPFMIPLLVLGMSYLFDQETNVDDVSKLGFTYELSEEEKHILEDMEIDYIVGDEETIQGEYNQGNILLYISKEGRVYSVQTDQNNEKSMVAMELANNYLNAYKSYLQEQYLYMHDIDPGEVMNIISVSIAKSEEEQNDFFANYITVYAFLFVIMAITVSATYPATDTTAGEKERGTLETLLTFPIKERDIIVGKLISVTISSIITGMLSLVFAYVSLVLAGANFKIYEGISILPDGSTIGIAVLIVLLYSLFISGLCIAIASKANTFKEAQSALTPLTFISFFPGMIAFMIHIESSLALSCVPFLNFTLVFTDVNNGVFDIVSILLMVISTVVYIVLVLGLVIKQYTSEKVLFSR